MISPISVYALMGLCVYNMLGTLSLIAERGRPMALMQPYPTNSSKGASQIPQPYQPPSVHPSRSPQARPPQLTPAFQVIPSRTYDPDRTEATLEAAMQSLVLDARRPVALEIAADGTGARSFLVR